MALRIAFCMEGNMGSILLRANFVKKFVSLFAKHAVDVTIFGHPNIELTKAIFDEQDFVNHIQERDLLKADIYKHYDLILKIDTFPTVLYKSKVLRIKSKKCYNIVQKIEMFAETHSNWIFKTSIYRPYIYQLAKMHNKNCVNCIDMGDFVGLGKDFIYNILVPSDYENTLKKFNLKENMFITINRGSYTIPGQGEGTRVWPLNYYNALVGLLKTHYPRIKIVQLGQTLDCTKIDGCDLYTCGKTNTDELKCLLNGAVLHIDGEGGMVHLRKAMNSGPSVVLFGSTDPEYFGHESNINLRSDYCPHCCCEMHDLWMHKCLISGTDIPICLKTLKPETVFNSISDYLSTQGIEITIWPETQKLLSDKRFVLDGDWAFNWLRHEMIQGYTLTQIPLADLYYWRQTDASGAGKIVPLTEKENPGMALFKGNIDIYNQYNKMKSIYNNDKFHSQSRYVDLVSNLENNDYDIQNGIIVVDGGNVIKDGWHRACFLLNRYGKKHQVKVVKLHNNYHAENKKG